MSENSPDLPQECWELIFNYLDDHRHFDSLSLVSHQFLSITNHLHHTLKITIPTTPYLPRLLRRFPNLKKIDFNEYPNDLYSTLYSISRSGLDLESVNISNQKSLPSLGLRELGSRMKNLKELYCSKVWSLQDTDLVTIAESCPSLEVLDISYPEYDCSFFPNGSLDLQSSFAYVTDSGILDLSMKLKKLYKINISGNQFITDKSLISISSNLVCLREILIRDCDFMTEYGIGLVMRNCVDLVSISVNGIGIPSIDLGFEESFTYARGINEIDISDSFISDELLCLLGEAGLPLKKLIMSHCHSFTFVGLSFLLSKYQSLEYLNIEGANFLNDDSVIEFSKFLCSLRFINLGYCSKLTNSTFYTLLRNCPLLSEIKMETTNLGLEEFTMDLAINTRIKSLHLGRSCNLSNEFLEKVALLCPNLEVLDVSYCLRITKEGIAEVLKGCREIKHLEINFCRWINSLGVDFELQKLEVLRGVGSGIDDDGLDMVAETCRRLWYLDLENCLNVTATGVKNVVKNCRVLREINLRWCDNVSADIVPLMVVSRPSLRKIIGFALTENQLNFCLRHGCLVCEG